MMGAVIVISCFASSLLSALVAALISYNRGYKDGVSVGNKANANAAFNESLLCYCDGEIQRLENTLIAIRRAADRVINPAPKKERSHD